MCDVTSNVMSFCRLLGLVLVGFLELVLWLGLVYLTSCQFGS